MKNLLRSTLYLSVFAIAGILFQISCSNSDSVKSNNLNSTPIGKIVYVKTVGLNKQLWTANYDGTNQNQISVNFPSNVTFSYVSNGTHPRVSPDGQKIFFVGVNSSGSTSHASIYSCDINGTNLQEIVPVSNNEDVEIGVAY
jgi:Tol biopolymer transport system component